MKALNRISLCALFICMFPPNVLAEEGSIYGCVYVPLYPKYNSAASTQRPTEDDLGYGWSYESMKAACEIALAGKKICVDLLSKDYEERPRYGYSGPDLDDDG